MRKQPRKQTNNSFEPAILFDANAPDARTLLQRELDTNNSEQLLLQKRILLMKEFMNDLPTTDSQYSMIAAAIRADQIEIDELQRRASFLLQTINSQS